MATILGKPGFLKSRLSLVNDTFVLFLVLYSWEIFYLDIVIFVVITWIVMFSISAEFFYCIQWESFACSLYWQCAMKLWSWKYWCDPSVVFCCCFCCFCWGFFQQKVVIKAEAIELQNSILINNYKIEKYLKLQNGVQN